jgi:hypothetical protein
MRGQGKGSLGRTRGPPRLPSRGEIDPYCSPRRSHNRREERKVKRSRGRGGGGREPREGLPLLVPHSKVLKGPWAFPLIYGRDVGGAMIFQRGSRNFHELCAQRRMMFGPRELSNGPRPFLPDFSLSGLLRLGGNVLIYISYARAAHASV